MTGLLRGEMADDKLELNSIDRFRKRPQELVLEEYGSCEVPAGCGGVVMRWLDPRAALSAKVIIFCRGEFRAWLDAQPLTDSLLSLKPGSHLLCLAATNLPLEGPFLASLISNNDSLTGASVTGQTPSLHIASSPGIGWRFQSEQPPDHWQDPTFNDSSWPSLIEESMATPGYEDRGRWAYVTTTEQGAKTLRAPVPSKQLWLRLAFDVPGRKPKP